VPGNLRTLKHYHLFWNSVMVVEEAVDAGEQEIEADCKTAAFELNSC